MTVPEGCTGHDSFSEYFILRGTSNQGGPAPVPEVETNLLDQLVLRRSLPKVVMKVAVRHKFISVTNTYGDRDLVGRFTVQLPDDGFLPPKFHES